jgi:transposase
MAIIKNFTNSKNEEKRTLKRDIAEEHAAILRQRRAEMDAPNAQFFTWEEVQLILKKSKIKKQTSKYFNFDFQYNTKTFILLSPTKNNYE